MHRSRANPNRLTATPDVIPPDLQRSSVVLRKDQPAPVTRACDCPSRRAHGVSCLNLSQQTTHPRRGLSHGFDTRKLNGQHSEYPPQQQRHTSHAIYTQRPLNPRNSARPPQTPPYPLALAHPCIITLTRPRPRVGQSTPTPLPQAPSGVVVAVCATLRIAHTVRSGEEEQAAEERRRA